MEENEETKEELNKQKLEINNDTINSTTNKKKSHKKLIIILTIIVIIIIGLLIINRNHYVFITDYRGEYDIQYIDLIDLIYNKSVETIDEFEVQELMTYDEYTDYCNRWNLEINYSNENSNYIVYSSCHAGAGYVKARLGDITYTEKTARIYIWSEGSGTLANWASYIIIVPVEDTCITNVEINYVNTLGEALTDIDENTMTYIIYIIFIALVTCIVLLICHKNVKNKPTKNKYKNLIIICICLLILLIVVRIYISLESAVASDKPIIYLYPEEETEVTVTLGNSNLITCSYPKYTNGWNVLAYPNGDLIDLDTNRTLYSLYYENTNVIRFEVEDEGFVVAGEDTAEFLEEKLEVLGLTQREAEEFIIYWLPQLQENKYNYIRFATYEELEENMPLEIEPEPDTLIRILMTYKGLDEPIEVTEQELETPERTGFVAVEWGGTEIE